MPLLRWPPLSPDLNPIENLWSRLKQRLDAESVSSRDELFDTAQRLWMQFTTAELKNLHNLLPKRISEIIRNRAGPTHY